MAIDLLDIGLIACYATILSYSAVEMAYCYKLSKMSIEERAKSKAMGPFSMYEIDTAQRILKDRQSKDNSLENIIEA